MPRRESLDSQRAQGASSAYGYQQQDASQDPRSRRRGPAGIITSLVDRSSRHTQQDQDYGDGAGEALPPPQLPFVSSGSDRNFGPGSRRDSSQSLAGSFVSKASKDSKPSNRKSGVLSTHYVPSKMANLHQPGQYAHRRPAKRGGGMNAWNAEGHGRMGGEDEDGDEGRRATGPVKDNTGKPKKLVWNRFKWVIFIANIVFLAYSIAIMVVTLLVWFDIFNNSDVLRVGNRTELIISTAAGALCLLTAIMGFSGILLNNRAFLAFYTLFLWFCLALIVAPGYITYKKKTFNLEGKINAQWSRDLGLDGRVRIQNALHCCGYYSPFVEAVASNTCYPRSILPGCKSKYLKFERRAMQAWYTAAFALVPAQIAMIVIGLLCSNHVTYRLGKGIIPKQYRLDEASTAQLLNQYAADIAAQYPTLAQEALQRTNSATMLNEKGHGVKPSRASSFSSLRQ